MPLDQTVNYEYRCPFCKRYFAVNETESFRSRECPHCRSAVVPEPPGLRRGPILKVTLTLHQRRLLAALAGYTLGVVGAHKFLLNYNLCGTATLAASLILAAACPPLILAVWALAAVEATIYLLTPDDAFERRYLKRRRWFF